MTTEGRMAVVALVKTLLTIAGSTIALAALAVGAVAWFLGVQTKTEAAAQHDEIRTEVRAADTKIEIKADTAQSELRTIGRDVRTIKCLLTRPAKQRQNCGLEP